MGTRAREFAKLITDGEDGKVVLKPNSIENIQTKFISLVDSAEDTIDTFDGTKIRSTKYLITAQTNDGARHQTTEVLLTHDGDVATLTAYGTVLHSDNNQTLAFYNASIDGSDTVSLLADPQGFGNLKFGITKTTSEVV